MVNADLKSAGRLEAVKRDINIVQSLLRRMPLWRPAVAMGKEAEQIIDMIDRIEERFERKLVVTLLGPSGSGKSTLLNALAGIDDLSPALYTPRRGILAPGGNCPLEQGSP